MTPSSRAFRVGTRTSRLARVQTDDALGRLAALWPGSTWEAAPFSSPGDRDRATDLRESPPDFFTRDLDEAVLSGAVDAAIHSAKDVPDPVRDGLDWVWLPWGEDPRDALVLPPGRTARDLPERPVLGISSARREAWARRRFPGADLRPVRGNIEERLAQLDAGRFDALVMAAAALNRLGLGARVSEFLSLDDAPVPPGQGRLALTFRTGDERFLRLRGLFVKAVRFVGAGVGSAELCTLAGARELGDAEVCLYDALLDPRLLDLLPPGAEAIDVGKRSGAHGPSQDAIGRLLVDRARRGLRVVRLKGGDPGVFGRLAEEIDALDARRLPYVLVPGVSALTAATTGAGLPLTRRGVSRGFAVLTPRASGGARAPVDAAARAALPVVLFMATEKIAEIAGELTADGLAPDTPAALVLDGGGDEARLVRAPLSGLAAAMSGEAAGAAPGLLVVGEIARAPASAPAGALGGRRVLLTCSEALMDEAARAVEDYGGIAVRRPMIRIVPDVQALDNLRRATEGAFDAIVLTSPSAVRCFGELLRRGGLDARRLPAIAVSGAGTARALEALLLKADVSPGADGASADLPRLAMERLRPGARVLRLRSDRAGPGLAERLRALGAVVTDAALCRNETIRHETAPRFDAVFFASASAAEAFESAWGLAPLEGRVVVTIGRPTAEALRSRGRAPEVVSDVESADGAIAALVRFVFSRGA